VLTRMSKQQTSQLDQSQIVGSFLLVAHQDRPALLDSAQRALRHPPSLRVALLALGIQK
jgi:hypothetical protein